MSGYTAAIDQMAVGARDAVDHHLRIVRTLRAEQSRDVALGSLAGVLLDRHEPGILAVMLAEALLRLHDHESS